MHVGDTVLPLEDPGALQLDVLHAARDRSNASSHAEWWRTARHDRLPNHAIREMRHTVGLG